MTLLGEEEAKKRLFGHRVLIDTNVVIYLTEDVPAYGALARFVFQSLEQGEFTAVLSNVTVAEVMMGPLRAGKPDVARRVGEYLLSFPNTSCQAVDSEVLAALGADRRVSWDRLRTVDALILSSGFVQNADVVLSNDLRWKNAMSSNLLVTFDQENA